MNPADTPIHISVIVAVGRADISRCVESLLAQTYPRENYEILLVADQAVEVEQSDNVRVIMVSSPNPSLKRNAGAREARGEVLAFIDDDAWARDDWLENGVRFLKEYPGAAGVGGPRLLPPDSTFREKATDTIANSKFFGNGHGNWHEMRVRNRVPHGMINACNYFIRRRIFQELHGYNEVIGYGGEDTEFIYRAVCDGGCQFAYTWDLVVYHPPRPWGWELIKARFHYRVQNGKMLWVNPGIYLSNLLFSIGLFGITAFLMASLFIPRVFLVGLACYFAFAIFVASKYARYDRRFMFVLPPAFFIHHSIYYVAIWVGFLSVLVDRSFVREMKNHTVRPHALELDIAQAEQAGSKDSEEVE